LSNDSNENKTTSTGSVSPDETKPLTDHTAAVAARKAEIEESMEPEELGPDGLPVETSNQGPNDTLGKDGEDDEEEPDDDDDDKERDSDDDEDEDDESLGIDLPVIRKAAPGADAGIDAVQLSNLPSTPGSCVVSCIDYSPNQVESSTIDDLEDFIIQHRPDWASVRWINVDGLTDMKTIQAIAEKYELHPLAIEDLLHIPQRPKIDIYSSTDTRRSRVFLIGRMFQLDEESQINSKQVSIFLGHSTVITFQENLEGDVWGPIRERLQKKGSRLRANDASFLVYALLDSLVDHCFPILEEIGEKIESLDEEIFQAADFDQASAVHQVNRDLMLLRRQIVPMRDMVVQFQRTEHECISINTQLYLRDVTDHLIQIIDLIDTYREVTEGMTTMIMHQISIRMNESIKVLAVVGTIFTPITFLASVYGMNFTVLPELQWEYSYWVFWVVCIVSSVGMLAWFKWKKWL